MRKTIGASEGASIYTLGVFGGSALSILIMFALSKAGKFAGMDVSSWVGYVVMQVAFFAVSMIYAKVRKVDLLHVAKVKKFKNPWQIALLPLIAFFTILIFLPLANAFNSFLEIIGFHGGGVSFPDYSNVGIYFLSLFVMAILPAFGEELLMRGSVFGGLSTKNVWFGILLSALFFSLMHANPQQTVHQFGLGISLAITMCLTGSIFACVFVHFFNNFISITITAYIPQVDEIYFKLGYWNWLVGAVSVIVGIFGLVATFYAMYKLANKRKEGDFRIVAGGIEYDEFTLYATQESDNKKSNQLVEFFRFFGSLFTKAGWQKVTRALTRENEVEIVGKAQRIGYVWIALALAVFYWLYSFISGMI